MTSAFAVLVSMLLAQGPAATVVLEGRPITKVENTADGASRTDVTGAEREKLKVVIVRKGDRYFWASRENREVERRTSGAFDYFIDRTDGGYVRVFDRSTLPESLRPDGGQFEYTEHQPVWRSTVTYWGVLDRFEP